MRLLAAVRTSADLQPSVFTVHLPAPTPGGWDAVVDKKRVAAR